MADGAIPSSDGSATTAPLLRVCTSGVTASVADVRNSTLADVAGVLEAVSPPVCMLEEGAYWGPLRDSDIESHPTGVGRRHVECFDALHEATAAGVWLLRPHKKCAAEEKIDFVNFRVVLWCHFLFSKVKIRRCAKGSQRPSSGKRACPAPHEQQQRRWRTQNARASRHGVCMGSTTNAHKEDIMHTQQHTRMTV